MFLKSTMRTIVLCIVCFPALLLAQVARDPKVNAKSVNVLLDSAVEFITKTQDSINDGKCLSEPRDCEDILECGEEESGVYKIYPLTRLHTGCIEVFCDMETDNGGWTVLQRRGDFGNAKDFFTRNWDSYKKGFGDPSKEFWLGNDIIFALTNQKQCSLRFDLRDVEGNKTHAIYDDFYIDSEEYRYKLHVSGYTGNAGDSFMDYHNGMKFSTKDRDFDKYRESCPALYMGGWWYNDCVNSNLNGLYLNGTYESENPFGVIWEAWRGFQYSLPFTEMKIRSTFPHKQNC